MSYLTRSVYHIETHGLNARIGLLAALTSGISLLVCWAWGNHYTMVICCWTAFILAFAETPAKPKLSTWLVLGTGFSCTLFFFLGIVLHPFLIWRTLVVLVFAFLAYYIRRFGDEYLVFPITAVVTLIVSSSYFQGTFSAALLAGSGSVVATLVYLFLSKLIFPVSAREVIDVTRDALKVHIVNFINALVASVQNKFFLKTAKKELLLIQTLARSILRFTNLNSPEITQQFWRLKLARRLYEAWHNAYREKNPLITDPKLVQLLQHTIFYISSQQRMQDLQILKQLEEQYILQQQVPTQNLINSCNLLFTIKQIIEWR